MLASGTRLGLYEILSVLGAGGMGEVYRARDGKLNRDVAIKVLPPALSTDRDRVLRFEREAQTLASLNHPNIAQVFGVLEEPAALVMEFVEGEDVSQRVSRGPLSTADAVHIARQIADALDAAHERGIVHRDLKPANIKVRADGTVKVLDFGLAKLAGPDASGSNPGSHTLANSPTFIAPASELGMILGTAAYMAPEQARGLAVDKRADIWAFGVVFYEMLSGRSAFAADSLADTLARVIERDPDWTALPSTLPSHLRQVIRRCLVKDPRQRLRDIGDARLSLDEPVAAAPAVTPRRRFAALAALGGLAAAVGLFAGWIAWGARAQAPVSGQRLHLPIDLATAPAGTDFTAVISPDGAKLAWFNADGIAVRWLADGRTRELVRHDDVRQVFWSPDSLWVGFATEAALEKVPLEGGETVRMADLRNIPGPFNVISGNVAWFADGRFVFATGFSGLIEANGSGGLPVVMTPVGSVTEDFHGASALPDGGVLTSVHRDDVVDAFEVVYGAERVEVFREPGAWLGMPVYSATGHILFARSGANSGTWAMAFDVATRKTAGQPFRILSGVRQSSVSADGRLLLAAAIALPSRGRIAIMTRTGQVERLIGAPIGTRPVHPTWSTDRRSILIPIADGISPGPSDTSSLWAYNSSGAGATQVTSGIDVASGRWWPLGRRLLIETGSQLCLSADCYRISWKDVDGSAVTPLVAGFGGDISPDGKTLVYGQRVPDSAWDLFTIASDGTGTPKRLQGGPGWQLSPRFSPDGQFFAFVSTASGRSEVWVASITGGQWRVANEPGGAPQWSGDGTRLYYARGTALVEVPFTPGAPPAFGAPVEVFPQGTLMQSLVLRRPFGFDVDHTGHRFLIAKSPPDRVSVAIELVHNWLR